MLIFYFDASALAKAYVKEKGSPIVNHILEHTTFQQWRVLMLGLAETVSILVRKKNGGVISHTLFQASLQALRDDFVDNKSAIKIETTNAFVFGCLALHHQTFDQFHRCRSIALSVRSCRGFARPEE